MDILKQDICFRFFSLRSTGVKKAQLKDFQKSSAFVVGEFIKQESLTLMYTEGFFLLPVDFRSYIRRRVDCVLSQRQCEVQSVPAARWLSNHQQQTVESVRDQLGCHWIQKLCFPIYRT